MRQPPVSIPTAPSGLLAPCSLLFNLHCGYLEAKDSGDEPDFEIRKKIALILGKTAPIASATVMNKLRDELKNGGLSRCFANCRVDEAKCELTRG